MNGPLQSFFSLFLSYPEYSMLFWHCDSKTLDLNCYSSHVNTFNYFLYWNFDELNLICSHFSWVKQLKQIHKLSFWDKISVYNMMYLFTLFLHRVEKIVHNIINIWLWYISIYFDLSSNLTVFTTSNCGTRYFSLNF